MLDLVSLKKDHSRIQHTTIGDYDIVFRLLSLKEFDVETRLLNLSPYEVEKNFDKLFLKIVLDPIIRDIMPSLEAGVVNSLCALAIYLSGIIIDSNESMTRFNDALEMERNAIRSSPYEQMFAIICSAFTSYTIDALESLSMPEVMRLTALAELVLQVEEPFTVTPPPEEGRLTDTIFQDNRGAMSVDAIEGMTPQQYRDMEVIKRIKENRQNG